MKITLQDNRTQEELEQADRIEAFYQAVLDELKPVTLRNWPILITTRGQWAEKPASPKTEDRA